MVVSNAFSNSGFRTWSMSNLDTGETIIGAFEATNVSVRRNVRYAIIASPGRQNPIVQFVSGEVDEMSLTLRVFAQHTEDFTAFAELSVLREWASVDPELGRPPVLSFRIGDGHAGFVECVLTEVSEDHVDRIQQDGSFKGAEVNVRFLRYESFTVEGGEPTESRFVRVKLGDYYELLAQAEYGDPLIGDVIRARNPTVISLESGDVVKLPSRRAIATEPKGPRCVAFKTAFGKKDTPQRARFREVLEARGASFVSHKVKV